MSIRNELLERLSKLAGIESGLAASLGAVDGVSVTVKFGHCEDAGAVETDVWAIGGTQPVYIFPLDAGESLTIESSEIADTQQIVVIGLDAAGLEVSVTASLTGATPVAISGIWTAVNRAYNSDGTRITGSVLIKGSVSGNIFAVIDVLEQQTTQCIYTVPSNKYAILRNVSSSINTGGNTDNTAIVKFLSQEPGGVFRTQVRYGLQQRGTSNISSDLIIPPVYPPLTRLKVTMTPDSSPMNISSELSMQLIDEAKANEINVN